MIRQRSETGAEGRIRTKRIYRAARNSDGKRILVDRIWPRGLSKDRARLDAWMKDIAPSDGLRTWFHENAGQWEEFKQRYFVEIEANHDAAAALSDAVRDGVVTLLYASADEERNNAVALREYLLGGPGVRHLSA
jgi:uncharacterized protein YeaO (DUF488 family)